MNRGRQHQWGAIVALGVIFLAMGVGFASYSQKLTIGGSTSVMANLWSVHFLSQGAEDLLVGQASREHFRIDEVMNVVDFGVKFVRPGDMYTMRIPIVNDGTFDATLSSIEITPASIAQEKFLHLGVVLEDSHKGSNELPVKKTLYGSNFSDPYSPFAPVDFLADLVDLQHTLVVRLTYVQPNNPNDLPASDIPIDISIKLNFEQK